VEWLVWLLSQELLRLGHEVTVFGAAGSEVSGELVATLPGPYGSGGSPGDWHICEWINLCRAVEQSERFDVLHSHAYLWGVPLQVLSKAPLVHTAHILPGEDLVDLWQMAPDACVTAISQFQWKDVTQLKPRATIFHGVDPDQFSFCPDPEDYVCYLGRFMPEKGPLEAIAAARALGLRILLAGPQNPYFDQHIKPLVDGRSVEYVGFVTGRQRERLLGRARALLYPLQYPEPFGLVIIEAMMCGTPVMARRLGAVPELVDEGITGACATSAEEFRQLLPQVFLLDRHQVRQWALTRFTAQRMAQENALLYQQLVDDPKPLNTGGKSKSGGRRCTSW
jgi:glycosyltransferase involved in cell wall biosynthesis